MSKKPPMNLVDYLMTFPGGIELERDMSPSREVDLGEATPRRARGRDGDPEGQKPAPGQRQNRARGRSHDR